MAQINITPQVAKLLEEMSQSQRVIAALASESEEIMDQFRRTYEDRSGELAALLEQQRNTGGPTASSCGSDRACP